MVEAYPRFQIERLPCFLPRGIARRSEIGHIHECDAREHNRLEQQKADSAGISCSLLHDTQELAQLDKRHVRVHIIDVGSEQGVAERHIGDGERTLLPEVANIFDGDARI